MWDTHVKCLYTNYSCVTLKKYEFNLTLKKAVLKKGICIKKKMDEVRESRMELEIHQEKVDFINDAYGKELRYWKRVALEGVSTENEAKELIELAPPRVILVRKVTNEKIVNIDEMIFYLKSAFSST